MELISSLFYPEHEARRQNVKPPWEQTFQWIFQDVLHDPNKWSNFPEWLRGDSSTYWINGKAGSGKSTLMAYIIHEKGLRDNLEMWSHGNEVHVLSFFFWRAGSDLQKTISGMLRSLLYQLLEEVPMVADILIANLRMASGRIPSWTERSLVKLLQAGLEVAASQNFCLFVDGLDEFDGDTNQLLDLILRIQSLSNVKCCLSSRPEVQLVARLTSCHQLQLQDLNYHDIHHFVETRLAPFSKTSSARKIEDEITFRAEGVFLWAALVTTSVVQGLQAGDQDDIIQKRIDSTPSAMEALFLQMLISVDNVHRDSLSFYIEATKSGNLASAFYNLTSVALLTAARIPEDLEDYADFTRKCQRTEIQIVAQSKGLLEVQKVSRVRGGAKSGQMWTVPKHTESGSEISTRKSRKTIVELRSLGPCSSIHQVFSDFEGKRVSFIHRSAYDFVCSPECEQALRSLTSVASVTVQANLVEGRLKLLAAAPSALYPGFGPDVRRRSWTLIRDIASYADLPDEGYEYLDELHDMLIAFSIEELCGLKEGVKVTISWTYESILRRQNLGELMFWQGCIRESQYQYVQEHLFDIANLTCGGLLLSILCRCCVNRLAYDTPRSPRSWADLRCITLLINMLNVLQRQYQGTNVRPVSSKHPSHFGEADVKIWEEKPSTRCNISSSYVEHAPQDHSHIVCELTELYVRWPTVIRSWASIACSNRRDISFTEEQGEEVDSLMRIIMEPWERYMSIQPSLGQINTHMFFQLSAAAFSQNAQAFNWKQEHDPAEITTLTYNSMPKLRIVCTSRNSSQESIVSERLRVVATHDLSHHVTARVLQSFEMISAYDEYELIFDGNWCGDWEDYLQCREMIINDVWENVDQKLDGWQQIYVLACMKTRFLDMWDIRSEGGDSDTYSETEF